MSKNKITAALASAAMLASLAPAALPTAAMAQQANGITNCDAPRRPPAHRRHHRRLDRRRGRQPDFRQ